MNKEGSSNGNTDGRGNTGDKEEAGRKKKERHSELTYLGKTETILALIQFDGVHELLCGGARIHEAFREHVRGKDGVSTGKQGRVTGGSMGSDLVGTTEHERNGHGLGSAVVWRLCFLKEQKVSRTNRQLLVSLTSLVSHG